LRTIYMPFMNKLMLFLFLSGAMAFASCHSDNSAAANLTTIQWIDSVKDFGTIIHGEKVKVVFNFLNSGDKPLYITSAKPSCGCTLADYTKSAVLPGQQGEVTAEFDSNHGMPQHVHKTVVVTCNAKNKPQTVLMFTGNVDPKK